MINNLRPVRISVEVRDPQDERIIVSETLVVPAELFERETVRPLNGEEQREADIQILASFHRLQRSAALVVQGFGLRQCPTCGSTHPSLHPAVQFEGEVQKCEDPWHSA